MTHLRMLFILTFAANVAVTLLSLAVLPARVATHFGPHGTADGWALNYVNALLMTGMHLLVFGAIYFAPTLTFLFPARLINLPHKEHWLRPANKALTREKLQDLMWRFGVAIFLFLFVIGWLSLTANLSTPVRLNLRAFYPALAAFLLYSIWWTVAFFRAFRLPAGPRDMNP